ncbi:MAG: hypothetical protein ACYS8Z_03800 [Planctomycetota bacterium]|jgi:hypothetical protein
MPASLALYCHGIAAKLRGKYNEENLPADNYSIHYDFLLETHSRIVFPRIFLEGPKCGKELFAEVIRRDT